MTMQSTQNRDVSQSSMQQISATIRAATPSQIKAILLTDGWHDVSGCQLVQFAFGESHSPITPSKLYPYLVYTDNDREVYTPISQVLSFDLTGSSLSQTGQTQQK